MHLHISSRSGGLRDLVYHLLDLAANQTIVDKDQFVPTSGDKVQCIRERSQRDWFPDPII